jgi:hypothetical protein
MFFSCSSSFLIPFPFLWPPIYNSLISPQREREREICISANSMETTQTTTFHPSFLLHTYGVHLSYGNNVGGDILGYYCRKSSNIHKINIGYPNTYILGIDYWETGGNASRIPFYFVNGFCEIL